jgi:hypothetical protein
MNRAKPSNAVLRSKSLGFLWEEFLGFFSLEYGNKVDRNYNIQNYFQILDSVSHK